MKHQKLPVPLAEVGARSEAAEEKVSPRHPPLLGLRHQSNDEHWREPATRGSEIGRLALIEPCRYQ